MRRRTTTQKLQQAIANNLLVIKKAEIYFKTSKKTETIDADKFKESLDFLCESGVFSDCVGQHYEKNYKTEQYIAETGRMDGSVEKIIVVYLDVCNGACKENIERVLEVTEEE